MRACTMGWFPTLLSVAVSGLPQILPAAEIRSGEDVVVKKDEVIADDLYVFGRHITIDGTVEGDVVAFGEQIEINGVVKGHVMGAGQTVVVLGEAAGARIAGQVLKLGEKAKLDGDILAAGLSLECAKDSEVLGDALFAGYQALFAGRIRDDVRGGMANCRVEGSIGGDINVEAGGGKDSPPATTFGPPPPVAMPTVKGGLTITESAEVTGDLIYQSSQEADIDPAAKIGGEVDHRRPASKAKPGAPAPPKNQLLSTIFGRTRHIVAVLVVGLVALLLLPRATAAWVDTIRTRPVASLLGGIGGFIAFIVLLIVAVIAIILVAILLGAVTLGELVPLVVIGGIVGYAALIVGFWIVAAFLSEALLGMALGHVALRDSSIATRIGALLIGVLVLGAILSIPYLGGVVGFFVLLLGLGSICLWLIGHAPTQSFLPPPMAKPIPATMA